MPFFKGHDVSLLNLRWCVVFSSRLSSGENQAGDVPPVQTASSPRCEPGHVQARRRHRGETGGGRKRSQDLLRGRLHLLVQTGHAQFHPAARLLPCVEATAEALRFPSSLRTAAGIQ